MTNKKHTEVVLFYEGNVDLDLKINFLWSIGLDFPHISQTSHFEHCLRIARYFTLLLRYCTLFSNLIY